MKPLSTNKLSYLLNFIKWAGYLIVISFIVFWIDWKEFLIQIKNANISYLITSAIAGMLIPILESERIRMLFDLDKSTRAYDYLINTKALLLGQTTFGVVASDAYRIYHYKDKLDNVKHVTINLILLRALGLSCALIILVILSCIFFYKDEHIVRGLVSSFPLIKSPLIITILLVLISTLTYLFIKLIKKKIPIHKFLINFDKEKLPTIVLLSLLIILIRSLILVLLALSFSWTLSIDKALFITTGAQFISIIPAPLNGLGLREGGLLVLITSFNFPVSTSAPVAFSFRIILLVGAILMYSFLLLQKTYARK